jgi:hypothetical protein
MEQQVSRSPLLRLLQSLQTSLTGPLAGREGTHRQGPGPSREYLLYVSTPSCSTKHHHMPNTIHDSTASCFAHVSLSFVCQEGSLALSAPGACGHYLWNTCIHGHAGLEAWRQVSNASINAGINGWTVFGIVGRMACGGRVGLMAWCSLQPATTLSSRDVWRQIKAISVINSPPVVESPKYTTATSTAVAALWRPFGSSTDRRSAHGSVRLRRLIGSALPLGKRDLQLISLPQRVSTTGECRCQIPCAKIHRALEVEAAVLQESNVMSVWPRR